MKTWIDEAVFPNANGWEEDQEIPESVLRSLASRGLFGACLPGNYGGMALDSLALGEASAEIARGSVSLLSVFVVHAMVSQALLRFGDDAQKNALLPRLATGDLRAAFALTEPDFGSDAANIACAARRTDGGILLNGRKRWISGSCYADLFLVFAHLENRGAIALLVPTGTPGLTVRPMDGLLGFRAAGIAELTFTDCLVPDMLPFDGAPPSLLGPERGGFVFVASHALDTGRFVIGWGGVGVIEGCLAASLAYARERVQFGAPLGSHQLIQEMIADMATGREAARALGMKVAAERDAMTPDSVMNVSMFKYFSSRACVAAATQALQLHGGNGCSPDFPIQRYFRDARIFEIIEGSSQMQQMMIASAFLKQGRAARRKRHDS